ncbi:MAG: hypothetical protein Q7V62_02150 [Actinomycetota bacterium]|nr:hypothetical protein [Actinomycetota bacterium]
MMATAPTGPELPPLTPIDIRRAVLAVLIRAGGGPLTISEVVRRTREDEGVDLSQLPGVDPRQRVSDMLRHQVRAGRAEVVGRGTYRLLVQCFSEATIRRCLHWRIAAARRNSYPRWVPLGRALP